MAWLLHPLDDNDRFDIFVSMLDFKLARLEPLNLLLINHM